MTTFADFADGRDNNFNLIRFLAASGVLISHAYPISQGPGTIQPLERLVGMTLGHVCVLIFFAISGFLILRSFERSSTLISWTSARVLRIFPALVVVLLLTVLFYGPLLTRLTVGEYFSDPETITYFPRNISLAFLQYPLPGVLTDVPYVGAINGSLWTLFYEVVCYGGVVVAGLLGFLRGGRLAVVLSGLYVALYVGGQIAESRIALNPRIPLFLSLSLPFFIGMVFYRWRAQLPLNWLAGIALALLALALRGSAIFEPAFVLALCYWVFLLGYRVGGPIRSYNELGDYSYGVYIYAFPMQQAASHFFGPQEPLTNMAVAAPLTLFFAVLSWHLIERRALASKRSVAAWFERRLRVSRAGL